MSDSAMKPFLVSYDYGGERWSLELKAEDIRDAEERLEILRYGTVDGELKAKISAPRWFARLLGHD